MNDLIGPITNPVDPMLMTRRVLGVNHLVEPSVVAEAYRIMNEHGVTNMEHLIVVRGRIDRTSERGFDEVSLCDGGTDIAVLRDGKVTTGMLTAESFGLMPITAMSVSPPSGMSKGDFSMGILNGEIAGPAVAMVLANAALLFQLLQPSLSLKQAYALARDAYESGQVPEVVNKIRAALPKRVTS